jgi:hypothetical protein
VTTPYERTKAVVDTRELLQILAAGEKISVAGLVQSLAVLLLRHYPLDIDIATSANAIPELWTSPSSRESGVLSAGERRFRLSFPTNHRRG